MGAALVGGASLLHLHIRRSFYITSAVRVVACAGSGAFGGALFERISGYTKIPGSEEPGIVGAPEGFEPPTF